MGDLKMAERYVNSSWQLLQHAVAADHLGQIYERQGKRAEAAHAYRLALAVNTNLPDTRARLQKLGVADETRSAGPVKGPRVVQPVEELYLLRRTPVPEIKLSTAFAEFLLLFSATGVEEAKFLHGDSDLQGAGDVLKKTHFNFPLPDQGPAKIARRGILTCSPSLTPHCNFVLVPPPNLIN
jgi:hypothetical protein